MASWRKKFERWEHARQPVDVDEVDSIIFRVFGDRVEILEGGSHRWLIRVAELSGYPAYTRGHILVPIKAGQVVRPIYLKRCFEAARLLGLYPPEDNEDA